MEPVERFAALVRAPEADLRLDVAAFCISASLRPGVDVDAWCRRLDDLAATASPTFAGVCASLFTVEGFRGDTDDYSDPRNSFLDEVIERRRGIPITLAVLLIEVARRHDIAVQGVGMPGHFLVQEAGVPDCWCDPFHGGARLDRAGCARLFAAVNGGARPLADTDLAPTPPRAILARMLTNLEHGRLGSEPRDAATLCSLHLAIPGIPLQQHVELLRRFAGIGDPEQVAQAYADIVARAPEPVASKLQAEARLLRARWN
jgi:Transglutaminase-like superfamily